jgi:hypothetical protein
LTNFDVIKITCSIGLGGWFLFQLSAIFLHKVGKQNSFTISETDSEVIIRNNKLLSFLNSISIFFLLSIFTFFVAWSKQHIAIYLIAIYCICLIIASLIYLTKKKFKLQIHKWNKTIILKSRQYLLDELEISDLNFWITDDFDSYGLYIKDNKKKPVLLFGYSVFKDIKRLKEEIEVRLEHKQ